MLSKSVMKVVTATSRGEAKRYDILGRPWKIVAAMKLDEKEHDDDIVD